MKEMNSFKKKSERLKNSLICAIDHFRKGNDNIGFNNFLNGMEDLENLLEYQECVGDLSIKIDKILLELQMLYDYIKNQDIIGMTDLLEFKLYPLIEEWIKGCGDQ